MLDLYFAPTPNGWKITIMLEECGLAYNVKPVNLGKGDQFHPDFLKISPNNRMPAIVDHDAANGPLSIFESGAILVYLAEKTGRFMPSELHQRFDVHAVVVLAGRRSRPDGRPTLAFRELRARRPEPACVFAHAVCE